MHEAPDIMEFQDYAAKETSALFGRLRASQTGATLQQLQAIREAIDAAARAIETAPEPDQEIDELIAGLTAAAHEEARRAGDESRRISQEARRAIDEAEAALQKQVDENAGSRGRGRQDRRRGSAAQERARDGTGAGGSSRA